MGFPILFCLLLATQGVLAAPFEAEAVVPPSPAHRSTPANSGSGAMPSSPAVNPRGLDCVIEPKMTVDISSPVPGTLSEVLVERGDIVEKDQPLAKLNSGVEEASVKVARARALMMGEILAAEARSSLGGRVLKRTNELFQKKLVPWSEEDEAETKKLLAEHELRKAREDKELAEFELVRAEQVLKQRTLLSTIRGVVVDRFKSPGEYVEDQPVMKIAQIDQLNVEVIAPLSMFGKITLGSMVPVKLEERSDVEYRAKVIIVDRTIDAASGTFGVRLDLPNPDYRIPAGVRCDVKLLPD